MIMTKMVEIICKCGCGLTRMSRYADVKRDMCLYYNQTHANRHIGAIRVKKNNPAKEVVISVTAKFNKWLKNHVKCLTKKGKKS